MNSQIELAVALVLAAIRIPSEERIGGIDSRRREELDGVPAVERIHLFAVAPYRRSRAHDFRPDCLVRASVSAELLNHRLIESNHGAKGTGNQVELVLDDQSWR